MSVRHQFSCRARGARPFASWVVERLEGRRLLSGRIIGITGNQQNPMFVDETLYDIIVAEPGTSDPTILDGFTPAVPTGNGATTTTLSTGVGVTVGAGSLRVDAPQGQGVFWGARTGNIVDLLRTGANLLSYDLTLIGSELNGG